MAGPGSALALARTGRVHLLLHLAQQVLDLPLAAAQLRGHPLLLGDPFPQVGVLFRQLGDAPCGGLLLRRALGQLGGRLLQSLVEQLGALLLGGEGALHVCHRLMQVRIALAQVVELLLEVAHGSRGHQAGGLLRRLFQGEPAICWLADALRCSRKRLQLQEEAKRAR